ncbi:MAG: FhaA domain-containing protein [Nocardioides sp.]
MGALQSFERRLETLISGLFARAFRSAVQPVEISAALQRELDNNAQILSRDRRLVPNAFHVELAQTDLDRLSPYDSAMASELTTQLTDYAEQQSYVFPGPVSIAFEVAADLTTGRFRIRSRAQAKVTGEENRTQTRAARAYLEINGTRHPLRPPGLIIGRGTEAHVRINDPGVSRQHIEFGVSTGSMNERDRSAAGGSGQLRLDVRDLGSTNGMLVDGHKATNVGVRDGTVVVIGKTTITVVVTEEDIDV